MGLVQKAEIGIKKYNESEKRVITYTQLRKIYSMTLDTINGNLTSSKVEYLRMKIMYQCARDENVKRFYTCEFIGIDALLKKAIEAETEEELIKRALLLKTYMESLVAFYKYYIDK